jgi:pimeloyl-ACP methyl ester carboxylesterase
MVTVVVGKQSMTEPTVTKISVRGCGIALRRAGSGRPLLLLHGAADAGQWLPYIDELAARHAVIAPEHPGFGGSDTPAWLDTISDVANFYLDLIDQLDLRDIDLVGHDLGGWIAAELAVRHPERIGRLALIGACGLFVSGQPIGDVFMHAQPERGTDQSSLRALLFADAKAPAALRFFPDGRGDLDEETRRYQMLRFGSFVGFKPPYFYDRALIERLYRAGMPALVISGGDDRMVPRAHAQAYAAGLPGAGALEVVNGAGHAVLLEQPQACADLLLAFLRKTRAS